MSGVRAMKGLIGTVALLVALLAAPGGAAAASPGLSISSDATPTNFDKAKTGNSYEVRVANVSAVATNNSPIKLVDTLPKGLAVEKVEFKLRYQLGEIRDFGEDPNVCNASPAVEEVITVTCEVPSELEGSGEQSAILNPAEELRLTIFVAIPGSIENGTHLTNRATAEGGGAPEAAAEAENEVNPTEAPAGFAEFSTHLLGPDGQPLSDAAAHPYQMTTAFSLNTRRRSPGAEAVVPEFVPSGGDTKDIQVALPPGLIGNPTATPRCALQQFNASHIVAPFVNDPQIQLQQNNCPDGSAVGYITLRRADIAGTAAFPIYDLVAPRGMPAQFGFNLLGLPVFIDTELKPSDNYQIIATVRNISEAKRVTQGLVTLWGTPSAPSHDRIRGHCLNSAVEYPDSLVPYLGNCPAGITETPSLRLPSSCGGPLDVAASLDTWSDPGAFVSSVSPAAAPVGCNLVGFDPTLKARPTTSVADSPSGLDADVHIPQAAHERPEERGQADLRDTTITFPQGLSLNPSGANGLGACSAAQIGLQPLSPSGFDDAPAQCPDNAKIGTVEVDTPLLDEPLHGSLFTAMPYENPFDSLLAVYIAVDDPARGIVVKLGGHVVPDPVTGQLSTTFAAAPQTPFEDFKVHLFEGPRSPLRTPPVCGTYSTTSTMTPWSAPQSGPPARPSDTYAIDHAPSGSCPDSLGSLPNAPTFEAGTEAPIAGAFSPMVIRLRREDDSQEFGQLTLTPPPGLVARLAGIPYCPDSALAAAAAKSGHEEEAAASCPAASRVGTVRVGAGAGPAPYYASGTAYLAGPYKGAPLSLAIITPATAGPYDLGTVVVRTALHVDPETARITAVSDPIPHILQGIPLDVRSIVVKLDHSGWGLNPTSCEAMSFGGSVTSTLGQSAPLSNRFQVGECGRLAFKPRLKIHLRGTTKRVGHPALKAVVTYPKGGEYANIARAQVNLPHAEFLDQGNLNKTCTKPVLLAGACPASTVYGRAKAWTPLLDAPLEGYVYLVGGYGYKLPALVAELNGQIRVLLVGKVDSGPNKGIRSTFEVVPDAPVSRFEL